MVKKTQPNSWGLLPWLYVMVITIVKVVLTIVMVVITKVIVVITIVIE